MPGENIYDWSTTAASNSNADSSIGWAEGQPRASVNNSARGMMAAHAKARNLTNGSIVTSGTANAQAFLTPLSYTTVPTGMRVLLKIGPGLTNTGPTTLSMDSIEPVTIKTQRGAELVAGELIANSYCEFRYDGANWILLQDVTDISSKVSKAGDTMTGALTVPSLTATGNVAAATITTTGNIAVGSITTPGSITAVGSIFAGPGQNPAMIDYGTDQRLRFHSAGWGFSFETSSGELRYVSPTNVLWHLALNGIMINVNDAYKPGGGVWLDSSDARIKNVIGDYVGGLAAIKHLTPVRYTFKGNDTLAAPEAGDTVPYKTSGHYNVSDREFVGIIAQDIEQHMPELVSQENSYIDGVAVSDLRVIDTTPLIFALVNSVKELLQRIEALEAKS